ncbi:MAG: hypothetical protein HY868_06195 [Chloroflexi bacterium]|nr:hypothetical protein [Chloroflexota bacterium]
MYPKDEHSLDQVESHLSRALHPVAVPTDFRAQLQNGLMLAARHDVVVEKENQPVWGWMVSAFLIGILVGVVLLNQRWRGRAVIRNP